MLRATRQEGNAPDWRRLDGDLDWAGRRLADAMVRGAAGLQRLGLGGAFVGRLDDRIIEQWIDKLGG